MVVSLKCCNLSTASLIFKYSRLSRFLGVCGGGVGGKPDPSVSNSALESFPDERGLAF